MDLESKNTQNLQPPCPTSSFSRDVLLCDFHKKCSILADIHSWQVFKIWCISAIRWWIYNQKPGHPNVRRGPSNIFQGPSSETRGRIKKIAESKKLGHTLCVQNLVEDRLTPGDVRSDTNYCLCVCLVVCMSLFERTQCPLRGISLLNFILSFRLLIDFHAFVAFLN